MDSAVMPVAISQIELPKLTLFVSSPGDVNEERIITARVIKNLAEIFSNRVILEPIFWEHEPMLMTDTFQTQIKPPSETDIFIGILWARMGTRLPANITREDGTRYASGTEYEFEDAWQGVREKGQPEILIYRKMAAPLFSPEMPDFAARMQQKEALGDFFKRWFQDEEGSFIAAFNPFNDLAEFEERLEDHLYKLLQRRFPSTDSHTHLRPITWREGSPFRGLSVFESQHAPVFFGRTRAVGEVMNTLRKQALEKRAFVMVLGMSGSGKSSLVRSGVLPLLSQAGVIEGVAHWQQVIMRPSDTRSGNLLDGLLHVLLYKGGLADGDNDGNAQKLKNAFAEAENAPLLSKSGVLPPETHALTGFLSGRLNWIAQKKGLQVQQVKIVLLIDQMEEIFTMAGITHEGRERFVNILLILARCGYIWVIGTFRSDFFHRCAELPALAILMEGSGQYLLVPPSPSEISQMIRLPAFAAGLQFESHAETQRRLDEILLDAMVDNTENLALLQFTLNSLYEGRSESGYLTHAAYQKIGGVEGALAQRAETVYNSASVNAQKAFSSLMRTLITVGANDDEPITGRRFLFETERVNPALQELLDAFIDAHLVITDRAEDSVAFARIAHEALLHHWPRLQAWIVEDRELLRVRARVKKAARHWQEENKEAELLLVEGKPLNEAELLLKQWRDALDSFVIEYILASSQLAKKNALTTIRHEKEKLQRSRYLNLLLGSLTILALLGSGFGYRGQQEANKQARFANEAKRHAEMNEHKAQKLAKVAAAQTEKATKAKNRALYTQSLFLTALAREETQNGSAVNGILLSLEALPKNTSKHERPYVPESEVYLHHALANLHEGKILRGHTGAIWNIQFSPDGQSLVSASDDHSARLWNVATGQTRHILKGHTNQVWDANFSHQGQWIATASLDKTLRLWNSLSGALITVLKGHENEVYTLNFSPDDNYLVSTSLDKTARIWSLPSGALFKTLKGHQDAVLQAEFSPNGEYILTASRDHSARLWNAETGALLKILKGHSKDVNSVVFSPQGKRALTTSDDDVAKLWAIPSGQLLRTFYGHATDIKGGSFSPDGLKILTYSDDQSAHLWNLDAEKDDIQTQSTHEVQMSLDGTVLRGHFAPLGDAIFSPDGREIVTVSQDKTVQIWHAKTGKLKAKLAGHTDSVYDAAFSPAGDIIATASKDKTIRFWHTRTGTLIKEMSGYQGDITQLSFSPNNQFLLSINNIGYVWQANTGNPVTLLIVHNAAITHASFSPNSLFIITASTDNTARLWRSHTGEEVRVFGEHTAPINLTAYSPNGEYVLTAEQGKRVRIWSAEMGGKISQLYISNTEHFYATLASAVFSPDSQYVLTTTKEAEYISLWDVQTGMLLRVFKGHQDSVNYVQFSPDGKTFISVAKDHTGRVWDVATGVPRLYLNGHQDEVNHASFSSDGTQIATASKDNTAWIWNTYTGTSNVVLRGHEGWVEKVYFTPNNQRLVTVSEDGTVRLWDIKTGTQLAVLNQMELSSGVVGLSPDGHHLATISSSNTSLLWQVFPSTQDLISHAKKLIPRELSREQRKAFFIH